MGRQDLNNARDAQRRLLVAAATASGVEERLGEYIRVRHLLITLHDAISRFLHLTCPVLCVWCGVSCGMQALANQRSEDARKLSQSFVDLQTLLDRLTYHRGL